MHKRRQIPTPQSSRLRIKAFPHPNGRKSQLRPLSSGKTPTRTMHCIVFLDVLRDVRMLCGWCVVSFTAKVHNSTTSLSYRVYTHWPVTFGKEKQALWDITSKLGIKCQKTEMYKHLPSCNLWRPFAFDWVICWVKWFFELITQFNPLLAVPMTGWSTPSG